MSKVGRRAVVEGFDLGLGLSRIRGGNPNSLLDFARANDTKIYGVYGKGEDIRLFDNVMPEYDVLERNLNFVFDKSNNIRFNLDGINDVSEAVRLGGKGTNYKYDLNDLPTSNVTNWELNRIFNDQKLMDKTMFYRNGQKVEVPKF
ncbi:MAG TPA: hypothetical protein VLB90_08350 [Pseudomonadales bacterium]|nr:hypothetical protein [Pseudomonadales bacterium]